MAGKSIVFGSRYIAIALDDLSKNQLMDALLDAGYRELGENVDEVTLLGWVETTMGPVWAARGDKPQRLVHKYAQGVKSWQAQDERYAKIRAEREAAK